MTNKNMSYILRVWKVLFPTKNLSFPSTERLKCTELYGYNFIFSTHTENYGRDAEETSET